MAVGERFFDNNRQCIDPLEKARQELVATGNVPDLTPFSVADVRYIIGGQSPAEQLISTARALGRKLRAVWH